MLFLLAILPPQVLVTTSMRFDDDNRNDNNENTYLLSSLGYNLSPARKDVGPAGYVEGGGGGGYTTCCLLETLFGALICSAQNPACQCSSCRFPYCLPPFSPSPGS